MTTGHALTALVDTDHRYGRDEDDRKMRTRCLGLARRFQGRGQSRTLQRVGSDLRPAPVAERILAAAPGTDTSMAAVRRH